MEAEVAVLGDQRLLARAARGDVAAFGKLYDRYAPKVFGLLLRIVPRHADAEDVLQETFAKIWQAAAGYRPSRAEPWVWIGMIARSRALDHLRRQRRQRWESGGEPREPSADETAAAELSQREEAELVRGALAQIPAEQREPIRLSFYQGATHLEIAKQLGVPFGTVKTRIRLGMRAMEQALSRGREAGS